MFKKLQNLLFEDEDEDIEKVEPQKTAPQSAPAPTPQEQGRRAYVQQAAKAAVTPPITPESPPGAANAPFRSPSSAGPISSLRPP